MSVYLQEVDMFGDVHYHINLNELFSNFFSTINYCYKYSSQR